MTYCKCPDGKQEWYGIVNIAVAQPTTDQERSWLKLAQYYAGLVLCTTCGGIAPCRGEYVGSLTLTGAAHILKAARERWEREHQTLEDGL